MSAKELAALSEVSKSEIYNIENGVHSPKLDTLIMLAHALRVQVEDLYEFDEKSPENWKKRTD